LAAKPGSEIFGMLSADARLPWHAKFRETGGRRKAELLAGECAKDTSLIYIALDFGAVS
jgi:hypothetical protein